MFKSTASASCHLDSWNLQLTTACRSQMSTAVNAGDWLAQIDHAELTLVHLNEQPFYALMRIFFLSNLTQQSVCLSVHCGMGLRDRCRRLPSLFMEGTRSGFH